MDDKKLPLIKILITLLLVGILIFIFINRDNVLSNFKTPPSENKENSKLIQDDKSKENDSPLEKAISAIKKTIENDPKKTVSEISNANQYSFHYFGNHGERSLIVANSDYKSGNKDGSYDLYLLEKDGQKTLLYSGIKQGLYNRGEVPEIKISDLSFKAEITLGVGDVCFSSYESILVDVHNFPKEYLKIEGGRFCNSMSDLSFGGSNRKTFTFEPVFKPEIVNGCSEKTLGAKTYLTGLMASSSDQTYTKTFDEPVEMECIYDSNEILDIYSYSRAINYENVKTNSSYENVILEFNINLRPLKDKKNDEIDIPIRFSQEKGFY